jgi:hypothetical protein
MKKYILLILTFYLNLLTCFAQVHVAGKDSIQICYSIGSPGIGGQDHCISIWVENNSLFAQRICYSTFNDIHKYIGESTLQYISRHYQEKGIILELDTEKSQVQAIMRYYQENGLERLEHEEFRKQAILRHYQENNNYLVLDKCVEISKSKLDELIKIIHEIKTFISEGGVRPDGTIIVSTGGSNHYVIKDENGTFVIVDWLGHYNRSRDIEKVLGLKNYLRCPCVEDDLKQIKNNHKSAKRLSCPENKYTK